MQKLVMSYETTLGELVTIFLEYKDKQSFIERYRKEAEAYLKGQDTEFPWLDELATYESSEEEASEYSSSKNIFASCEEYILMYKLPDVYTLDEYFDLNKVKSVSEWYSRTS